MEPVSFLRRFGLMVGLVLLQVLILNRISLFGYATPMFYIWFIVRFESSMTRNAMLIWGFFIGIVIDMFTGTPGLNAACSTILALLQPKIVTLFLSKDRRDIVVPSRDTMGGGPLAGYLFLTTLVHHTFYFIFRGIPLGDWTVLMAKIVFSTLLTFLIMFVVGMSADKSDKRRSL